MPRRPSNLPSVIRWWWLHNHIPFDNLSEPPCLCGFMCAASMCPEHTELMLLGMFLILRNSHLASTFWRLLFKDAFLVKTAFEGYSHKNKSQLSAIILLMSFWLKPRPRDKAKMLPTPVLPFASLPNSVCLKSLFSISSSSQMNSWIFVVLILAYLLFLLNRKKCSSLYAAVCWTMLINAS